MKRFGLALVVAALMAVPAFAGKVTVLNGWQEVMEAGWDPSSSFCATDTAHAVMTWLLAKDADVRFVVKVWEPTRRKEKFVSDYAPFSAGEHITCLACQFGFREAFPDPGVYKIRVKVQGKGAGKAGDIYRFNVGSCGAAAASEMPAHAHQ